MKVYLMVPYSGTKAEERFRFSVVTKYAGRLLMQGFMVFSPVTHCHPIALLHKLPGNYEFWKPYCKSWIDWADVEFILCVPGWKKAIGVKAETQIFIDMMKPIHYVSQETYNEAVGGLA